LRNPDAYRACLNDLEDHQRQRRIEDRTSKRGEAQRPGGAQ
jgi:hypothetical protein